MQGSFDPTLGPHFLIDLQLNGVNGRHFQLRLRRWAIVSLSLWPFSQLTVRFFQNDILPARVHRSGRWRPSRHRNISPTFNSTWPVIYFDKIIFKPFPRIDPLTAQFSPCSENSSILHDIPMQIRVLGTISADRWRWRKSDGVFNLNPSGEFISPLISLDCFFFFNFIFPCCFFVSYVTNYH